MPTFPKLIYMECMTVVLLNLAHKWRQPLEQELNTLKGLHRHGDVNHSALLTQPQGLLNLSHWYISARFIFGSQVTDCHCAPQTEEHTVGSLLSRCVHVLVRLTFGYDQVPYARTIDVSWFLWSQWY